MNCHELFRKVGPSSPLPIRSPPYFSNLSKCPAFPLALRSTRVVFLVLKQFSSKLETAAEVILMVLMKLISGETDAGEPRPGWMRVCAMEIMCR